jgi:hypothetical protein
MNKKENDIKGLNEKYTLRLREKFKNTHENIFLLKENLRQEIENLCSVSKITSPNVTKEISNIIQRLQNLINNLSI